MKKMITHKRPKNNNNDNQEEFTKDKPRLICKEDDHRR